MDTDYVSKTKKRTKVSPNNEITEYHSFEAFREILENNEEGIALPSHLYTIKLSHCFWDIQWEKTMSDIKFFQDNKVLDYSPILFDELFSLWNKIHSQKAFDTSEEEYFKSLSWGQQKQYCIREIESVARNDFLVPSNYFCSIEKSTEKAIKKVITASKKFFVSKFIAYNWNRFTEEDWLKSHQWLQENRQK